MESLSQLFERQYLWNEGNSHNAVLSLNNVIHKEIRRSNMELCELSLQVQNQTL